MDELWEYLRGVAEHGDAAWQPLLALDPAPELQAWLRVLVKRSAIPDSLADKRDRVTAFVAEAADRAAAEQSAHGEEDAIERLAVEWRITRLHVRRLLARREHYVAVLRAVLAGYSYPEVATELGLSRREVELTVRYLEELLAARDFGA